ncbi:MAG: hypothetical protein K2X66_13545, partial [Cyanobacteria bacterium]|nr:hypothetical protein [Cyanobacteriota bacterium]
LFLFDEPTTGLHLSDIERLVQVFRKLVEAGHSVIVIEHNLDFISQSDYLIDIGPDGGERGGEVIATGTPREVMGIPESITGQYLKRTL